MEKLLKYLIEKEGYYKSLAYETDNSSLSDFYIGKSDGIRTALIYLEKERNSGSY